MQRRVLIIWNFFLVAVAAVCALPTLPALAEKRAALVIGNSAYVADGAALTNPVNDATDVGTALKEVGFNVVLGLDLDKRAFETKLREFVRALDDVDVALFFYAGHGLQVGGRNFLLPIDARLQDERDLDFDALGLDFVLRQMELDRDGKTNIVFLDACRDNPLSQGGSQTKGKRSIIGQGLAQIHASAGTFIAYSTEPDNTALDGDGRNSPFTAALTKSLRGAETNLASMMIGVRKEVLAATGGKQVPWDHSALTREFYFRSNQAMASSKAPATNPSKLSLIVLPFGNLGHDAPGDHFAEGITADLTSGLSRISGTFVIAHNTAKSYKGKAVDVKEIGRELGVRYALDGNVQKQGDVLNVGTQLIDAETGAIVWSDRFSGPPSNLQSVNEEVTARLARNLSLNLVDVAARRVGRDARPDVADLVLRGRSAYYRPIAPSRENYAESRDYFQAALALSPDAVDALIGAALVDVTEYSIFNTRGEYLAQDEKLLDRALAIEPNHAVGHYARSFLFSMTNRAEAGRDEALLAISLDPSLVDAYQRMAQIESFLGRPDEALKWLDRAQRISPRDRLLIYWDLNRAFAHVLLGHDEEAVALCRKNLSIGYRPHYLYWYLIAALAQLGRLEEAKLALIELTERAPSFATIAKVRTGGRSANAAYLAQRERIFEGLRRAGMPEG